jgi:hypothetical protein
MAYTKQSQRTLDALLQLKDAGLVAADDNAQVGGSDQILDMGTGIFKGEVLHDISALEIASGDEVYKLIVQGSSSATFASDIVDLQTLVVGDASTIATTRDVDSTTGRYICGVSNVLNDVAYQYVRLRIEVAGTIATGINMVSYLVAC